MQPQPAWSNVLQTPWCLSAGDPPRRWRVCRTGQRRCWPWDAHGGGGWRQDYVIQHSGRWAGTCRAVPAPWALECAWAFEGVGWCHSACQWAGQHGRLSRHAWGMATWQHGTGGMAAWGMPLWSMAAWGMGHSSMGRALAACSIHLLTFSGLGQPARSISIRRGLCWQVCEHQRMPLGLFARLEHQG